MADSKDVLVFFSYRSHKNGYIEMLFDRLREASSQNSLNLFRGSLTDLHIEVKYNKLTILESLTGRDLNTFNVIYFELWYKAQQQALAAAYYAKRHDIPFFSEEIYSLPAMTKVGEIALLADSNIPLPHTVTSSRRELKKIFKKNQPINYPLIVKAADGYGGKSNYLVNSYKELADVLDNQKNLTFVVQEFIPNDKDYRCLVMGGKITLVLRRSRASNNSSHLNNTSAGAEGVVVSIDELSVEAQRVVLSAAAAVGRSSFAGVDLIIHKDTKKPYILEVNQTPQIEIGAAINDKMNALLSYVKGIAK